MEKDEPKITIQEYQKQLIGHIQRVIKIGMYIHKKYYPRIDKKILLEYLMLHDKPKFNHLEELVSHYGQGGGSIKVLVNKINEEEEKLKEKYKTPALKEIEELADMIDRGISPDAEKEFGRTMIKASEIFSGKNKEIALHCEAHYDKILKL